VRALAELSSELRDDERILCTSNAAFGERHGRLAVLARGHDPHEPGLLAITGRRLLFAGERGGWLVLEREQIASWALSPTPGERTELWADTPAGSFAIYDVSARLLELVEETEPAKPRQSEPAGAAVALPSMRSVLAVAAACLAALMWTLAVARVEPNAMGDAGLVSTLPLDGFLALALICAAFGATLASRGPSGRLLAVQVLALVFMLYAVPYLVGGEASFNVAWRHVGISEYIAQHGAVDPDINAYFNWPGFFVLSAAATELAGADLLDVVPWMPFLTNLLYLAPLLLIARAASDDPRLPWAAAWVFYLTNWVYQDYLSPQGLTYVLYLALAGLLLTWMRGQRRSALLVACFLLVLAAVPSHQLTPFAMLTAVAALTMVRSNPFRSLPALLGVLIVSWVVFAAGPYLSGHLETLKDDIGHLGSTISSNVTERVDGSETHVVVTRVRLATTAVLWLLAAVAAWQLWRRREWRFMRHAALAAAPFGLVALQAYGGEILLRVYLFGLPFVSLLVARLVFMRRDGTGWRGAGAIALASVALLGAFLVTRYGNERVNLFTSREIASVERVYDIAAPGSVIVAPNPQLPWQSQGVGEYRFKTLDAELEPGAESRPAADSLAAAVVQVVERFSAPAAYVVITRNNREYEELFGAPEWGTIAELERSLAESPRFRRVFDNGDGEAFAYVSPSGEGEGR
jgi:hypothetical protein